jgi:L-rhamnose-H+ transport protein
MANMANEAWKALNPGQGEFLYQNNVSYIIILWGGLATNFIWTTILSLKNKSYRDFSNKSTPRFSNVLFCALAGTTWFLQFFFYGMGESKLGNGASSWILHMSTIILTANMWGIVRKEWKGVSTKTKWTFTTGIAVIMLSVVLVGIGNSM